MTTVRLSKNLLEQGYSYAELARMARESELVRVRRGAYAAPPVTEPDPRVAHLQLLEATVGQSSPESVVSHISAAVLHGLPIGNDLLARVHLTRDRPGQGKVRRWVQVHGQPLADDDIVEVGGFWATSLARTVVDVGCALRPLRAVPVGDAALRAGLDPDELAAYLERCRPRYGIAQARRTAALLDARSESPGVMAGEPSVATRERRQGHARCRLDDQGVEHASPFDVAEGRRQPVRVAGRERGVQIEKQREDRLRDLGWQVVRWIWADLYRPAGLIDRLHRAFVRGRRAA